MQLKCFDRSDWTRGLYSLRSGPPQSRDDFDRSSEFILGHFTSSVFLESILERGLLPDTEKNRAINDRLPSDCESVYLTARYDRFYAERAVKHHDGEPIVIEVLVDRHSIIADESALSPDELASCTVDEALYRSLCCGSCKHPGPVLLTSILTISDLKGSIIYENKLHR